MGGCADLDAEVPGGLDGCDVGTGADGDHRGLARKLHRGEWGADLAAIGDAGILGATALGLGIGDMVRPHRFGERLIVLAPK